MGMKKHICTHCPKVKVCDWKCLDKCTIKRKYQDRLAILQENKRNNTPDDNYPYDLDIKSTKEFLKDLEKIL